MPFPFGKVCDLLQSLENDLKRKRNQKGAEQIVRAWFAEHRLTVDNHNTDKCALLSTLLPERRTDRVFNIKEKTLSNIFARALGLGHTRQQRLTHYEIPGSGVDLAECFEEILKETPNLSKRDVTVEEIDHILHELAAGVSFSSPAVRSSRAVDRNTRGNREALGEVFRSLSARDAKWFTRLVLKNYLPVMVPEYLVYGQCHKLLPALLKIHEDFVVALRLLEQQLRNKRILDGGLDKPLLPRLIKPQIGVKVGRQTWQKGRSVKHCLDLGRGLMSVEKKMDGEYCQIHVDLSKGPDWLQIFSKSGKDSTADKYKLHGAIKSSLGIGTSSCSFRRQCILEGEMVVYSHKDERILGFDKIRKHVMRSGRRIGIDEDSQAHDYERLMIVYFDVLLIDDDSLLSVRHSERYRRLSKLVHCHKGEAALVERQIINFSSRIAAEELKEAFASCIVNREEGLVLKPDEPYFNFGTTRRGYVSCCVKLKKGYIKNMGDVGDFAVVGARYDATTAKLVNMPQTKYTHFYLGCLTNSEEFRRFPGVIPEFTVVNEVELIAAKLEYFQLYCFTNAVAPEQNDAFHLSVPPGLLKGKKITTVFKTPAVFEMTCFSFQKAPNTSFWSLRFPYVSKIHCDREWQKCVDFDGLQKMAEEETTAPEKEDSQELAQWIKILEQTDPKSKTMAVDETTQSTEATTSTCSSCWVRAHHASEVICFTSSRLFSAAKRANSAFPSETAKGRTTLITSAFQTQERRTGGDRPDLVTAIKQSPRSSAPWGHHLLTIVTRQLASDSYAALGQDRDFPRDTGQIANKPLADTHIDIVLVSLTSAFAKPVESTDRISLSVFSRYKA
ncbi:hypothetical protein VMCG_05665 [Cytospora schulzeri]|uniref:ATP-dependent DNA ligase family profile domain-containing protein n=1 Tax=Cytospora schulzeri TaxID=448051 RepID=A0A423WF01_9PEZI|nr:hypothetical protein VMCG_05665 [Valsa malicola]